MSGPSGLDRLMCTMSDDMAPTIDEEDKAMSTLGSQSAFLSMLNMGNSPFPLSSLCST